MYIIRNKISVICSKIRVGMGGGGSFSPGGVHISQGNMDPRVHIHLLNMDPGYIFGGGGHIQYDTGNPCPQDEQSWTRGCCSS